MEEREHFIPEPGAVADMARALLAVADNPAQVHTHRGGTEFSVPSQVAERYRESLRPAPRRRSKKEGDN